MDGVEETEDHGTVEKLAYHDGLDLSPQPELVTLFPCADRVHDGLDLVPRNVQVRRAEENVYTKYSSQ